MKLITLLFILPACVLAQGTIVLPKDVETKGYTLAISEYIKSKHNLSFDTLFVGKHEDFTDVILPKKIENTVIVILTTTEAENLFKHRPSFIFTNMIGDFTKNSCSFKLIVFKTERTPEKNYWWPLHIYNVSYDYNPQTKVFKLDKTDFEYPYSNKYADKK